MTERGKYNRHDGNDDFSYRVTRKSVEAMRREKNNFWNRERENNSLRIFRETAIKVPAYKDFLKKNGVKPSKVKTFDDFKKVPIVSKANYLKKYPLKDLSWNGSVSTPLIFTSTSGSTGEPFYFSRSNRVDWQSSVIHEFFFENNPYAKTSPTLVLVCFGMGVWIGGLITYHAFQSLALRKGYPISILTPGINKEEIFKALKNLAPNFENVILAGYPPFIKDIIDEANDRWVNLKKYNLRVLFAAEAFTENFREYISKNGGVKNQYTDTMNIYGSADIGSMAFETPLSIMLRKISIKKPKIFKEVFGDISKTPTLAQYNPSFISFEEVAGSLLLTGDSSIPLVRYSIGDHGGVYSFNELRDKFLSNGVDIYKEAKKAGISKFVTEMPFVYVFERSDFSTTLYGLQVYPETIREILLEKPYSKYLTGKLSLSTRYDVDHDQYLEIDLEERKDKEVPTMLRKRLRSYIIKILRQKNSEFRELSNFLKKRAEPKAVFWRYENAEHFKPGIKQRWAKK